MIARLVLALLLVLPVAASAQPRTFASTFLEGSWGLRLDGSIIMRWDLELTENGWTGTWVKPGSFASDGVRFGSITMPSVERKADRGQALGDWAEITFDDPRPNEEPDQFRFHLTGADRAEMIYVGTGLPPFTLERVAAGALLGPFEQGKVYGAGRTAPAAAPALSPPPQGPKVGAPARPPVARPPAPGPATPPPAQQPPPPDDDPVQGPPAMIGR